MEGKERTVNKYKFTTFSHTHTHTLPHSRSGGALWLIFAFKPRGPKLLCMGLVLSAAWLQIPSSLSDCLPPLSSPTLAPTPPLLHPSIHPSICPSVSPPISSVYISRQSLRSFIRAAPACLGLISLKIGEGRTGGALPKGVALACGVQAGRKTGLRPVFTALWGWWVMGEVLRCPVLPSSGDGGFGVCFRVGSWSRTRAPRRSTA